MNCRVKFTVAAFALWCGPAFAGSADRFADVEIAASHVAGNVHMLTGAGGNLALSLGAQGTLLVDNQFLPLATRIHAAIEDLGGGLPAYILNTHHHGDHVGGNPYFGRTGTIIAHANVRLRMLGGDGVPAEALPSITYEQAMSVHFNGEQIELLHLPRGHTDGDSAVWFRQSKVLHMGDQLFNGRFPFIDVDGGGTVGGYIANLESIIAAVPADTRVIPGHGELADVAAIGANLQVIRATRQLVVDALDGGASVEQVIASGLGADYAGWSRGFVTEERWIRIIDADRRMMQSTAQ